MNSSSNVHSQIHYRSKKALEDKHESLKQISATIKLEAETDFLNGLYNRRYLIQSLHRFIEQANLNDTLIFSLFMLDIDHFKENNDQFGHEAGDDVLQIAQIMLKNTHTFH